MLVCTGDPQGRCAWWLLTSAEHCPLMGSTQEAPTARACLSCTGSLQHPVRKRQWQGFIFKVCRKIAALALLLERETMEEGRSKSPGPPCYCALPGLCWGQASPGCHVTGSVPSQLHGDRRRLLWRKHGSLIRPPCKQSCFLGPKLAASKYLLCNFI